MQTADPCDAPGAASRAAPRAIVLGGYGLIGAAVLRALHAAGFSCTGVGRSTAQGRRAAPFAAWIACDLGRAGPEDWARIADGADVVVNAAGALQDGPRDSLRAIHVDALAGLLAAMEGASACLIQISAAGVSPEASTAFFRTKAEGDALVAASGLDWCILRPGLALSPQAYGGTALLRAAAAFPLVEPRIFPDARIQTLHVDDLAEAAVAVAQGRVATRRSYDLAEENAHDFPALLRAVRGWQGFPAWRAAAPVPGALLRLGGLAADLAGRLGWRSPMRSTALAVLAEGVRADPAPWREAGGPPMRALAETLAALPSTRQERLFARLYLPLPVAIVTLAGFWIASGAIGLAQSEAAARLLTERGAPQGLALATVIGGGIADLCLGAAVLVRPWARRACAGMIALTAGYLLGGAVFAPDLWADPLGPMVKPVPAAALALLAAAMLDER